MKQRKAKVKLVKRLLVEKGYDYLSVDSVRADLIVFKYKDMRLIKVVVGENGFTFLKEINMMKRLKVPKGVTKELWVYRLKGANQACWEVIDIRKEKARYYEPKNIT